MTFHRRHSLWAFAGLVVIAQGCTNAPNLSKTEAAAVEKILELGGTVVTEETGTVSTVVEVNLKRTEAGDDDMKHLAALQNVRTLQLSRTQIGDDGLQHLAGLSQLHELHLGRTKITDKGLAHLANLTELEWIAVNHTAVSASGIARLRSAIPDLKQSR